MAGDRHAVDDRRCAIGSSGVCLTSEVVARADLPAAVYSALLALFAAHYQGVTAESFAADLAGKDWVVLLRDEAGAVRGFTSFALYESTAPGPPVSVVYSGDTLVDPAFWGTPELPRAWIHAVLERAGSMPTPLYWLLLSSGYKTYRFLTVFFRDYYPCRLDTWAAGREVLDALAAERFGDRYDPRSGVVRLERATPLRPGVADVTERRLRDPDVAFFVGRNPGHAAGDELACLTWLHPDNFSPAGQRMAR